MSIEDANKVDWTELYLCKETGRLARTTSNDKNDSMVFVWIFYCLKYYIRKSFKVIHDMY